MSRSPIRSSRRSISRSPVRGGRRRISRSPIHARRRSPFGRRRSLSRSASPDGRIRRGRGFSQRYSYARRYRASPTPDRSPYRLSDRSDRDRCESLAHPLFLFTFSHYSHAADPFFD